MTSAFQTFVQAQLQPVEQKRKPGREPSSERNARARELLIGQSMDLPKETSKQTPGNMGRATGMAFRQQRMPDGTLRIWRIR